MVRDLESKVALVTGAGSGIGRASAIALAAAGAKVLVTDIDQQSGAETVTEIQAARGEAAFFEADVTDAQAVEDMVRKAVDTWGRLDCAHNNAGIAEFRVRTADLTEEVWDRTIDINLKGVWLCMKYEILYMKEHGGGAIVNTASVVGLAGVRQQPAYVASKHGIVGLTKAAALEYAQDDIRVNAVCPGPIRTPALDWYMREFPDVGKRLEEDNPSGRVGESEEVARAVVWLCSDRSSYITGHSVAIDGGVLAK
ncbi:MAG: SDR family oxidoreductase [Chloroflexi bacterium]|nr:SDR family oxidoreductase [Chloroflexota bacterium]